MNRRDASLSIAYLVNQYPQPSQCFIRREIEALEARGYRVLRYTLRGYDQSLADPDDRAERERTRAVLGVGAVGLALAILREALARPSAFVRAFRLALELGRPSERGVLIHMIYLAEACVLRGWLAAAKVRHVHAHFGTNSAAVAAICRALDGPPFSFTVHGPEEFDAPRGYGLGVKARHAAFVVAITEFTRSQLFRWVDSADWHRIKLVRCGLGPYYFEGPSPFPDPLGDRLVSVGRLTEQKGQLILIEAAGVLRDRGVDFDLTLIGDGPMRGDVERLIARLDLGDRVHLAGFMSNPDVRRAMIASRSMVLPSFAEGLPAVVMEALALGRPVITTYVNGNPELVEAGRSGWLVTPGAVGGLADAMAEALAAPRSELERMGRIGSARVAELHDARKQVALLGALIDGEGAGPTAARPMAEKKQPEAARP